MRPRTRRQREIFDYISDFLEKNGHEPSYAQIAKFFGRRSKSTVAKHIEALEEQGLLRREKVNGHFRIDLGPSKSDEDAVCKVEWLRLPEGSSNRIMENDVFIPKFMIGITPPHTLRALIVPSNAMLGSNIEMGDIAIVEKKSFAREGLCVAATVPGNDVILSRFSRNGGNIDFVPDNDSYDTLSFTANEVEIQGVFRGLLRPLS